MTISETKKIQYAVTIASGLLIAAHVLWPKLMIDGITLGLLFLAISPWLAPLFKSVELPGGMKLEFREFQHITDNANAAGLIAPKEKNASAERYTFLQIAKENPALALAGLRMEIESRLQSLMRENGISSSRGGLRVLVNVLAENQLLSKAEQSVLSDIAGTLNKAVHNQELDMRVVDWIIDVGPRLLASLDGKIPKKVVAKATCLEHDMGNWGHEKSEEIVERLSYLAEDIKADFAGDKSLYEKYIGHTSALLHNATKLFSFFSDTQWDVNDSSIILAEGKEGFEKVRHRYNRA